MESPKSYQYHHLLCIVFVFLMFNISSCKAEDGKYQLMSDAALDWPSTAAMYGDEDVDVDGVGNSRRSLLWHRVYYISYGALSANKIPCPARSGRSYYTHNCYKASGPVQPYSRGCSAITRCRR